MSKGVFPNGNNGLFRSGTDHRRTNGFSKNHPEYRKNIMTREMAKKKQQDRQKIRKSKPQYKEQAKIWQKNYYLNNKEKNRNSTLLRKFGITIQQYNRMIKNQNNTCAICSKKETYKQHGLIKQLAVDHCHKTQKVRELLCHKCNIGIGMFLEDVSIIDKAKNYLIKHGITV